MAKNEKKVPTRRPPRRGTLARREFEDRHACAAFLGPNGSRGGHPSDFDEPPDLTEVQSALTDAEWRESQLGQFLELPDPDEIDHGLAYPNPWYGYVIQEFGISAVMET